MLTLNRLLLIAFRNVHSHWRQSLAVLLSISASFFAFAIFEGYMKNLIEQYEMGYRHRSMLGDLLIENKFLQGEEGKGDPWKFLITQEQQKQIDDFKVKHKDLISEQVRFLRFQGLIQNGKTSSIFLGSGYDLQAGKNIRGENWAWNAAYGIPLHQAQNSDAIALGQGLGRIMGCNPINKVRLMNKHAHYEAELRPFHCEQESVQLSMTTESGALNAQSLQIIGLVDGGYHDIDRRYVMTSLENAQRLANTDKISFASFLLHNKNDRDLVQKIFNDEVGKNNPDLLIIPWQEHNSGELYRQTMELMKVFRTFVVIVILSISSMSVFNTMVKTVKERTREIGTLQSIGYGKNQIFLLFAFESFFLALLGNIAGALFSVISMNLVNQSGIFYKAGLLSEPVPFLISFSSRSFSTACIMLTIVAIVATYIACRGSLKKKIVECLSYV